MTISDRELLALLGEKVVELYLEQKKVAELGAALQAAKAELERRPYPRPVDDGA